MAARGWNSRETGPNIATPRVKVNNDYDIIVAGGGPAGCAAAIAAASRGCRTLLIEATGNLGGLGTSGMVPAWC
ncbi:MAG: FAD-dependent oxidoreductase, partial [Muribaculaceae bacterium]|nr:FAD-dependent oxidoreductase [Muribaculaceae bacterium]